jgi:sterol desaturase/sphingolipid hydroxylase (fatty acid hydroxylase superfamily)
MVERALRWAVWPLCLAANIAAVVAAAALVPQALSQVAAATTVLLIVSLVALEQVLPHRSDWSVRGDSEIWRDIGHSLMYAALAVNAARVLFLVVCAKAVSSSGLANLFRIWPADAPVWMQVLLVIVLGDGLEYMYHRLCHAHPLLWRLHAIHHTPVRLNALKGGRHHVLYAFGRAAFVWLPLLVLGAPSTLIYWQYVAVTITGAVGHANIEFRIPAFVHRLIVTPEYHRIHHSTDPRLGNSDFAVVFPLWDMVFGTHADPLRERVGETGIHDDPIPRRFMQELLSPVTYAKLVEQRQSVANPANFTGFHGSGPE